MTAPTAGRRARAPGSAAAEEAPGREAAVASRARDASAADEEDIPASSPASTRAKTGEERRPLVKT